MSKLEITIPNKISNDFLNKFILSFASELLNDSGNKLAPSNVHHKIDIINKRLNETPDVVLSLKNPPG